MLNSKLREEISKVVGRCLRQGRKARGLSLSQAEAMFAMEQSKILALENGIGTLEETSVVQMASTYGVHTQTIEFLIELISNYNQMRAGTLKKRELFSIVGTEQTKPWETEPQSIEELISIVRKQMKGLAPILFANVDYVALKSVLTPDEGDQDESILPQKPQR